MNVPRAGRDQLPELELIPRGTLADEIAVRICEAIWNGQLPPEERLPEKTLAEMLQVSRGPVREALSQLERMGLVVKKPNQSAVVAHFSKEDLYEVYTLRLPLERLAVQEAMLQVEPGRLDEMQEVIDTMGEYIERGIHEREAADLDVRFHEILVYSSRHRRLYKCWSDLKPQIYTLLLSRNVANPDFREVEVTSHQNILDAMSKGEDEQAVRLLEDHINSSFDRIGEAWGDAD